MDPGQGDEGAGGARGILLEVLSSLPAADSW